jgi:two-component system sensor histidine kinase KdpD
VFNVLANALKYTSGPVTVQTRSQMGRRGDAGVAVRIADQGPGLSEEEKARVFHAFDRGNAKLGASPGAGLGLTIARQVVSSHGGSVWIEDNEIEGRPLGLVACIWLPLAS